MSRWDIQNQLDVDHAYTATAVSTNSYAKQTAAQDIGMGRRMALLIIVKVAAGTGSSHTFAAIQADDDALTSNVEVLSALPAIAAASLTVGAQFELPIPQGVMTKKYLGFRNTIASGTTTVTLDVHLLPQDEITKYKPFPKIGDAAV